MRSSTRERSLLKTGFTKYELREAANEVKKVFVIFRLDHFFCFDSDRLEYKD